MKRCRLFLSIFLLLTLSIHALDAQRKNKKNRPKKVSAKIEVLMEGAYSKEAITQKAIEMAKIKAIGDEFGYAIIQGTNTETITSNENGNILTSSRLNSISNTLVKGEWISDDEGYPQTRFFIRDNGNDQEIWLSCEVRGKARAIDAAEVGFQAYTYNCPQTPAQCATTQFKHYDSMFLYFQSPVSGYLSVFMLESGEVYRLLPYANMSTPYESAVPVEADQAYQLFSPQHRDYFEGFKMVDEYGLTTDDEGNPQSNMLYVVFSPKPFKKPIMQEAEGLKHLSLSDFQDWLNQNQGLNPDLQVQKISLTVNK